MGLGESRYAIEQLLSNYQFYRSLYAELIHATRAHPSFVFDDEYNSDPDHPHYQLEIARYLRETAESGKRLSASISRLHGAVVSQNAIAGAVFQIAFMGIKQYSSRTTTPVGWEQFAQQLRKGPAQLLIRFGGGRLLWGEVPLGLVVYAARNQYNHQDEPPTNPLVIDVFTRIREYRREHRIFADAPSFDAEPTSVADHLMKVVGWSNFTEFSEDLIGTVSEPTTPV